MRMPQYSKYNTSCYPLHKISILIKSAFYFFSFSFTRTCQKSGDFFCIFKKKNVFSLHIESFSLVIVHMKTLEIRLHALQGMRYKIHDIILFVKPPFSSVHTKTISQRFHRIRFGGRPNRRKVLPVFKRKRVRVNVPSIIQPYGLPDF